MVNQLERRQWPHEPDTDKSSLVEGKDTPESTHMRWVAEEAINAVLNRIEIRSIKGNVVSMDVVAAGHSGDRAILVANLVLSDVVAPWRRTKHRDGPAARSGVGRHMHAAR
jgi:hypothetical protein